MCSWGGTMCSWGGPMCSWSGTMCSWGGTMCSWMSKFCGTQGLVISGYISIILLIIFLFCVFNIIYIDIINNYLIQFTHYHKLCFRCEIICCYFMDGFQHFFIKLFH